MVSDVFICSFAHQEILLTARGKGGPRVNNIVQFGGAGVLKVLNTETPVDLESLPWCRLLPVAMYPNLPVYHGTDCCSLELDQSFKSASLRQSRPARPNRAGANSRRQTTALAPASDIQSRCLNAAAGRS